MRRSAYLWTCLLAGPAIAPAQDPFEIQIYEYRTVPRGKWNLETHLNHTLRGTREFEGTVAPSENVTRLTFELTHGITDHFELAGYLAFARLPGEGPGFAAWRLRPRVRLPEHWNLPVQISISTEVAFPRDTYDSEDVTLEIRPIIERRFGRLQIDLNPVIGRSLEGPGTADGWDFEPGARVGVAVERRVTLSIEYYGALGSVSGFLPAEEQVHQFYTGGDLRLRENVILNLGLGLGVTDAGNRTVLKARLGWLFP